LCKFRQHRVACAQQVHTRRLNQGTLPPPLSAPQLGNSNNWKVCSSRLCSSKGAPKFDHADVPEQCVFGGYRLNAKQVPEKLNPDFDDGTLCKKSGSCIGGTCVGKDFPAVRACLVTAGPLRSARQCLEAPGGGIPARLMAAHLPFLLPPPLAPLQATAVTKTALAPPQAASPTSLALRSASEQSRASHAPVQDLAQHCATGC
jgi:hypothetical protein